MKLSPFAKHAIGAAKALGGRALIVGGSVRDHLLGIESKDIDIEIHGMSEATFRGAFATTLATIGRVDAVGVSFGVLKFGRDVDLSLPRRDSKTGTGHTGFTITVDTGMTVKEALSRRDFTINAIAWDPITGEFIDPFGGRKDLELGLLRHIGPAFAEDPLRVMRGVQFATRFGFAIVGETARMCRTLLPELRGMAKERLWGEWEKILTKGTDFYAMHEALHVTGVGFDDRVGKLVMFAGAGGTETRIASRFAASPDRAAAILGHWASLTDSSELFKAMDVPHDLRRRAAKFAAGFDLIDVGGEWTATDARQAARALAPVSVKAVCVASSETQSAATLMRAAADAGVLYGPHKPLVTGDTLIGIGWEPGPHFGSVLRALLSAQDRGEFTTTEEGLALVKQGDFG